MINRRPHQRRRIYAGMLSALDEGLGNITSSLKVGLLGHWFAPESPVISIRNLTVIDTIILSHLP